MENFTKEEIDSAIKIWKNWHESDRWKYQGFGNYLKGLSVPERKHMIIDVAFDDISKYPSINVALLTEAIKDYFQSEYNFEIIEVAEYNDKYFDD